MEKKFGVSSANEGEKVSLMGVKRNQNHGWSEQSNIVFIEERRRWTEMSGYSVKSDH